ncbi:TasA family protein [Pueribacillus sp. YX66]|uniref:TasA family protein n=1 Tax=Pueribacillus sp. YX66 TaxID=3229242 RepID=UPI00358D3F6B
MKWKFFTLYSIAMLTLIVFNPISSTGADENTETVNVDLVTKPKNVIFDVMNMKPGDVIQRTFSIENGGNVDVYYKTKAQFTNGSKKLYEELLLQVTDGEHLLYDGTLSNFNGFNKRQLSLSGIEELIFNVEFPYESGNEFQGLVTQFQIIFSADYHPIGAGESSSSWKLPKTGMVHPTIFLLTGLLLFVIGMRLYHKQTFLSRLLYKQIRKT